MSILKIFKKKDEKKQKPVSREGEKTLPKKDLVAEIKSSEETSRVAFVLKKPHVSEKAYNANTEVSQYVFIIDSQATKPMVRQAVWERYGVRAEGVNIIRKTGKTKHLGGRFFGRRSEIKKAVVSLKKGEKINID